jgi:phosphate-selective porin O/P
MKLTSETKTAFVITKIIPILIALFFFMPKVNAQMGYTDYDVDGIKPFTISSGDNVVKIGTILSSYLDLRQYPAGAVPDYTKNTIKPKDARLDIKGKVGDDYEYHLQLDFAEWGPTYAPDGGPLDDANFTYKGLRKLFKIKLGYGKVPYSLNSLVEHYESPYWERPQITKGDFMSRRDLGITLERSFWNDKIRFAGGVYTGVGEVVLGGTNDPSGAFEYIGRLEFSYPEPHHEEIIDTKGLTTPNISIGLNGRYSKRDLPAGTSFLPGERGDLVNGSDSAADNLKVVNGEKYILGADVSILYRGFSAQFEMNGLKGTPQNPNDPLLQGLPLTTTGGYFRAGGWYAQANYFSKPIKTIFTFRYDELNANDLVPGVSDHIAYGISYQVKGYNSMIKLEVDHNLQFNSTTLKYGGEPINTNKWDNEIRLGWQLVID